MKLRKFLIENGITTYNWSGRERFMDCHSYIEKKLNTLQDKDIVAYEKTNFATLFLVKGKIKFFVFYIRHREIDAYGYNWLVGEVRNLDKAFSLFGNPVILDTEKWNKFEIETMVDAI